MGFVQQSDDGRGPHIRHGEPVSTHPAQGRLRYLKHCATSTPGRFNPDCGKTAWLGRNQGLRGKWVNAYMPL